MDPWTPTMPKIYLYLSSSVLKFSIGHLTSPSPPRLQKVKALFCSPVSQHLKTVEVIFTGLERCGCGYLSALLLCTADHTFHLVGIGLSWIGVVLSVAAPVDVWERCL
jgi:hypothetical protein